MALVTEAKELPALYPSRKSLSRLLHPFFRPKDAKKTMVIPESSRSSAENGHFSLIWPRLQSEEERRSSRLKA
jgi:hypothetical protein